MRSEQGEATMLESKTFRVCLAATLICVLACCKTLGAQEKQRSIAPTTEYRIQVGDIIKLDVWKEPEITRTIPVDQKGYIHLPLIHDVKAAGLTAMELAGLLRNKLVDKIPNPQVTITITEIKNSSVPSLQPLRTIEPLISPTHQLRDVPSPELLQSHHVA
jgi:protein involved in polysaccharide export with SLBB domain